MIEYDPMPKIETEPPYTLEAVERLFSSIMKAPQGNKSQQARAAVYTRKSRLEPGATHYSMEIQPDRAEAYATSQDWQVMKVYADPHKTGRNSRRPGLQELIADIKSGKVDIVVVHRLDRLYRNLEALLKFIRLLKMYRVRLVSVTEHIDTNTPWGRLVTYVLGALAEMFVWQTSERTRESKAARVRKGLPNGLLPLGYCNGLCSHCTDPNGPGYCPEVGHSDQSDGRLPFLHPLDVFAVRLIYHLYNQGMSYKEIADHLNHHQFALPEQTETTPVRFRTKGVPGQYPPGPFSRDSIRVVICNPFYVGMVARYPTAPLDMDDEPEKPGQAEAKTSIQGKRRPLELQHGQHEAIIPIALWRDDQQLRLGKGHTSTTLQKTKRIYPLSGVGRCLECFMRDGTQSSLRGSSGWKGTQYYRCATEMDCNSRTKLDNEEVVTGALDAAGLKAQKRTSPVGNNPHHMLHADDLMAQVDELVGSLVIPEEWYDLILAFYLSEDGMATFERESYNLRQEMERLREMYRMGMIDRSEFQTQALRIENQLAQLKPSAHPDASVFLPLLKDFPALWAQLPPERKRVLLGIMFEGLYFDGQGRLKLVQAHSPFDRLLGLVDGEKMLAVG